MSEVSSGRVAGSGGVVTGRGAEPPADAATARPRGSAVADGIAPGTPAAVVTASNRGARGERADSSGQLLADRLRQLGFAVSEPVVVPDEVNAIRAAIEAALTAGAALVVTTGGTGVTPTDVTPEATRPLLDREIPGIAEAIRLTARDRVPTSVLSRGLAGAVGTTLVVNLPGSPGGVRDGMDVLTPILGHVLQQLHGGDHVAVDGGDVLTGDSSGAVPASSGATGGGAGGSVPPPPSGGHAAHPEHPAYLEQPAHPEQVAHSGQREHPGGGHPEGQR